MINRKKFLVSFFYGTDLRFSKEVEAGNEITALVMAMDNHTECAGIFQWVTAQPFRIEIKIKD